MINRAQIDLRVSEPDLVKLIALQERFASACNLVSQVVWRSRTWNRVALHHLAYQDVRSSFPGLGSQMACNAIYTVSRAARRVYQASRHLWADKFEPGEIPLIYFSDSTPVFFDKHTLNILGDEISLFTLEGRLKLQFYSNVLDQGVFQNRKISEIFLLRKDAAFSLFFDFSEEKDLVFSKSVDLPEFLVLDHTEQTSVHHG